MFGLTTTRHLRAELALAKQETDRQRERAETAEADAETAKFNRRQALDQLAAADSANRVLHTRLKQSAATGDAARLERRIVRLREAGKRILAAHAREKKRADHRQRRLDDAVGLHYGGHIQDSRQWQPGYEKPKADAK
ncbi:hypothetical protein [Streptomyces chartreusis]|uniref:hypothetical protein n=1 Tax=Streptomyces chartreusis TaxID=1969 RepID=UPI002E173CC4